MNSLHKNKMKLIILKYLNLPCRSQMEKLKNQKINQIAKKIKDKQIKSILMNNRNKMENKINNLVVKEIKNKVKDKKMNKKEFKTQIKKEKANNNFKKTKIYSTNQKSISNLNNKNRKIHFLKKRRKKNQRIKIKNLLVRKNRKMYKTSITKR